MSLWMGSISITNTATPTNLLTALIAAAPTLFGTIPGANTVNKVQWLQIQNDTGNGAAKLRVGNPASLTTANCGTLLLAGQTVNPHGGDSNLIYLADVGLLPDTNPTVVNVMALVR